MYHRFSTVASVVTRRIRDNASATAQIAVDFRQSSQGTIAIVFALTLVVVVAVTGLALDFGRWHSARAQAQTAIDAAVLAGGRTLQTTNGDAAAALATATSYYKQMRPNNVVGDSVNFVVADGNTTVTASGNASIQLPFLKILGFDQLPLLVADGSEYAQSAIGTGANSGTSLELSLILDLTGSMCSGATQPCRSSSRLDPLKLAAKDLIDIVVWDNQDQFTAKVAVVPYSMAVNVGTFASGVRGAIGSGTCTSPGCLKHKFKNPYGNSMTFDISTCVSERTGNNAYADISPATAPLGKNYPSPSNPCLSSTVTPLSNDKTHLKAQIDAMMAGGSTAGHLGVAFGWYTLSPNWASVWPATSTPGSYSDTKTLNNYGQPKLRKIAILMTDGEYNSSYCNGVISQNSSYGSGSAVDHINCNAPNGGSVNQAIALCNKMKSANVEMFSIGFDVVDDVKARDLLAQCATSTSHAYLASNEAGLKAAFRDIALKVSILRLTH